MNLVEKLLATLLAKASNFIPEAGIWLNTQRPEWNDANNALVGNGVSMVTLCYMKRFLSYFGDLLDTYQPKRFVFLRSEQFFKAITRGLQQHKETLSGSISDTVRKDIVDAFGTAASNIAPGFIPRALPVKKEVSTTTFGNL